MSQVIRKYNSGGQTDKPKLLSVKGLGDFNQEDLIKRGYRDVDEYASSKGLRSTATADFRNAVQYMLEGINNGTITMDAMGNFQDATGQKSSTGELDRKKFLGIKTGIKNTENNAYGLAADYLYNVIKGSPQYKQPEVKKDRFNTNDYLTREISRRWYGGNKVDFGNWFKNRSEQDRNALLGEIFSNADYNQLYQDYDWKDTGINSAEDLANRGKAFGLAITNNKLDNDDYNTFAALGGIGLDKFLKEAPAETEAISEQDKMKAWEAEARAAGATTPEAIAAFVKGKQQDEENANRAIIERQAERDRKIERDTFFNDYAARNPFRETIQSGYAPSSVSYKPEDFDKPIRDFYNNNINQYLNDNLSRDWFRAGNTQHIANHMDYLINHLKMNLPYAGDGFVAIPSTFDYNNYTTMVYNPTTRQYKESSMLVNDALRRLADAYYDSTHTPKRENGGVLYMQFGGTYSAGANYSNYQQQRAQEKKTKEEEEVKQKAESKGRTVEEQQTADRKPGSITSGEWTGEDYTRLGSIVADIGSMGAAYIPVYGTTASAVLGVGSSLANYGADLSENGFKWGDLGNLAMNLGLDTVGLIPGLGSAAKGSKMLKTAIKYIPKTLSLLAAYNYTGPAIDSMKKALSPDAELTVDDWRNIAEGFKLVLQGGKGIKRGVQARNLKKDLATGNKVLTTLGGKEVSVTPAELSEIRSHRKIEDQQAALQLLKKDDNLQLAGDLNKRWFNPSRYLPNSNIRNEYDFNKTVKKRTSQGIIEVPRVYSNSDKYIAATMRRSTPQIPGFDELSVRYNDWKYGVKKPKTKAKPKDGKTGDKKPLLALPAPGQVRRSPNKEYINIDISSNLGRSNLTDRGIITGSSPVISPDPRAIRYKRKAENIVNSQTVQPSQRLDQFIEGQIPGGRQFGKQRAKTEREYRDVFHPVAEREYNQVWDEAIRNRKDFGYEEVTPRRSPYAPPTPTEVYIIPEGAMKDPNARYLWELINKKKPNTSHIKRENLPHKVKPKKKKTSRDDRVTKKAEGGVVQFLQGGDTITVPKVQDGADPSSIKRATSTPRRGLKFNVAPEEVLALGRMVGGLTANNRAAKIYKEGLKPTLLDTFENTVPLQGNFQAVTNAEQQAGNLESIAARPRTSDASLQLAGELDASSRAGQARFQGGLQDAEMFYKTRMLGQQESDAAKARRIEVANRNRASMNAIDAAKKQIDAGRVTANYQQVIAPYLAGIENRFRQTKTMRDQLALEVYLNKANSDYNANAAKIREDYKDDPIGAERELSKLQTEMQSDMLKKRKSLISTPWLIQFSEKGSKLSYAEKAMLQRAKDFNKRLSDDNKQFHKDIMESKREHNKMIANMSALTAALIKKGMQL